MSNSPDAAGRRGSVPLIWVGVYLVVGVVGAVLQSEPGQEPWYPAAAVGVALLVIRGVRWWPLVLLCDLAVSAVQYREVTGAVVSGTCTAAEIVFIAVLLRRLKFRPTFERPDDMARLWIAGFAGALMVASVGSGLLRWFGATDYDFWRTWVVWFIGDSTGVLLVGPTVLLLAQPQWTHRLRTLPGRRAAEMRVVVTASYALVIGYFALTSMHVFEVGHAASFSLCLTPLVWVAVRGGLLRATMVVGTFDVVSLISYRVFALDGVGGAAPDNMDMVTLQTVILTFGLATLGIAVSIDSVHRMHRRLEALVDASPVAIMSVDATGNVQSWNRAAEGIFGYSAAEVIGRPPPIVVDHEENARRRDRPASTKADVVEYRHKDGHVVLGRLFAAQIVSDDSEWAGVGLIEDVTTEVAERSTQATLAAAVEQAGESIVVTTPEPAIIYANPAALASSGYSFEEVRGRNPRIFKSGRQDNSFYDRMWATLSAGEVWNGVLVNQRKDGSLYEERTTIAPVFGESGRLTAYVAVKHDLSRERLLENDLARSLTIRGAALGVMGAVERQPDASMTANALCARIVDVAGPEAAVVAFDADGNLTVIGSCGAALLELHGRTLPAKFTARYRRQLSVGSRVGGAADPIEAGSPWTRHLQEQGVTATMMSAIFNEGRLVGMLVLATRAANGLEWMRDNAALGDELGSFASALLGAQIDEAAARGLRRREIQRIIDERLFHPVFQSCHDLYTREVRSYEALTRFDEGDRPDVVFADAWRVGLGQQLEIECARVAVEAANLHLGILPLSLNFSPEVILSGAVAEVVAESRAPVVVEVTEHVPIVDYAELRRALDECHVKVSVDDAGAGFASMRHILELKADVVKLDIALIRGIDRDLGRQALAAGLCHYAAETGTLLIAEGVETQAEVDAVRRLGVHQAQGYYFGRPETLG